MTPTNTTGKWPPSWTLPLATVAEEVVAPPGRYNVTSSSVLTYDIKGWWEGGTVTVCGDVERQIAVARADERWVVVGTGVPSVVGIGWEGMASGA